MVGSPAQDDTMPLVGSAMALVVGSPTQDDTMAPINSSNGDALEFLAERAYLLGHLTDPTIKAATSGDLFFAQMCIQS